jgi:hypothetical protein
MGMMHVPPDFKEFLKLLNFHHVEYLLVGGYAVGIHGYPRPTGDMDIWIAATIENACKVSQALRDFGFDVDGDTAAVFAQENKIVRMGMPPLCLEIITTVSGVDFTSCFAKRLIYDLGDTTVNVIGLEDLKVNKQSSGRHKDLNDLEQLQ